MVDLMGQGGMAEGLIRCFTAMSFKKKISHKNQLEFIKKLVDSGKHLVSLDKKAVKDMINKQAAILKTDFNQAIAAVPELITSPEDKLVAIHLLKCSVENQDTVSDGEKELLETLTRLLDDRKTLD